MSGTPFDQTLTVRVIDSHTGGEPTRVVIDGAPDLGNGTMVDRRDRFRDSFDAFRSAVIDEPRGSDVWIGAVMVPPHDPDCDFGVIYFNTAAYLGMCGHGTIGLITTLSYLNRIEPGTIRLDTPVGRVDTTLHDDGRVTLKNVPSFRTRQDVTISVEGIGQVIGDVAWGGNWFFLVKNLRERLELNNVPHLLSVTSRIRTALDQQGITGNDGAYIDHVELYGSPMRAEADSKNFVLCPGGSYDRSPCGTGTSAKLACLAADGRLDAGQTWIQESIVGSLFEAKYDRLDENLIVPSITGSAHVMADASLILSPDDPFRAGINR